MMHYIRECVFIKANARAFRLTKSQKKAILDMHNQLRSQEPAYNMKMLVSSCFHVPEC